MKESLISFKGINEGIYIYIKNGQFDRIIEELEDKLKRDFFKGASILGIQGEDLSKEQINELIDIIRCKYHLNVIDKIDERDKGEESTFSGIHEGMTKFLNTTVRSGQVIEYDGNIVIIGDVNPGGLVKAKGNIIVLGSLKGVAHAGIEGNQEAVVAAYDLQPMQLRIGSVISRRPDESTGLSGKPEIARVFNGEVIIEPYLPRK